MEIIADILLVSGAIGAGIYCVVLGRRLNRFNDLEKGIGGAVAVLSAQVDDLTVTLDSSRVTAAESTRVLEELTGRAEEVARQLELRMASLHDIEDLHSGPTPKPEPSLSPAHEQSTEPMFVRRKSNNGTY